MFIILYESRYMCGINKYESLLKKIKLYCNKECNTRFVFFLRYTHVITRAIINYTYYNFLRNKIDVNDHSTITIHDFCLFLMLSKIYTSTIIKIYLFFYQLPLINFVIGIYLDYLSI